VVLKSGSARTTRQIILEHNKSPPYCVKTSFVAGVQPGSCPSGLKMKEIPAAVSTTACTANANFPECIFFLNTTSIRIEPIEEV
jgi:hypothetical protein